MRPTNKNTLLKVVILGDGGVGKSCLMNRFVSNQFDEHSFHTIGVEFLNKDIEIDGETYTLQVSTHPPGAPLHWDLQIWDTAGQERFKTLRTPFYRGSDICILTYAVDDKHSFRNLQMWKNEFLYYADVKENVQFPFIVVGNKVIEWSDLLCHLICKFAVWCWGERAGGVPGGDGDLVRRERDFREHRDVGEERQQRAGGVRDGGPALAEARDSRR
jgi:small GTP-binding protein